MLLENDNFLSELTKLFQQQRVKTSGSLSLTMKRYDGRTKPKAKLTKKQRLEQKNSSKTTTTTTNLPPTPSSTTHDSVEYKCLVRAVYGSKKLSTIVSAKDINRFQLAYANLLKANMDTLKKKAKETKTTTTSATGPSPSTNVPSSPTAASSSTPTTTTVSNQQKKTPTTPGKKK